MKNKIKLRITDITSLRDGYRTKRRAMLYILIGIVIGYFMQSIFDFDFNWNYQEYLPMEIPANDSESHWIRNKNPHENNATADRLFKEVKILCWVMTNPKNHKKKAIHVKRTWGRRCNKLVFMSTKKDKKLGSIALPVRERRDYLWAKTREAFKYIHKKYMNKADWFYKADDDTYAIMENMRYMLFPYSPDNPLYFGCRFKKYVKQGYMSGGAGYILSKEAVRRFVEKAMPNPEICKPNHKGAEDVELGKCLENVQVKAIDTRDSQERGRFFPLKPIHHLERPSKSNWYSKYIYYDTEQNNDCCSDYAISFHYIPPKEMYVMDYLIYNLRPFGISHTEEIPKKLDGNVTRLSDTINDP